ncbi:undecaprenyldiphospho-muramoylpentapeptide beta-N-acetylglucosaminyltransferase [Terriglobus sp. RCC_193]|uniref:undecaprenyldiphospho-muramoylpentapeptide beta-N-acetylglucosaminyltransferase n=1 Tax=Terriglobus sp. RCC_193 TaxID=3239218 RepID=UPI0035250FD3
MAANDNLRVLIAGGGTGGHVIPALAIARELRDRHAAEVRLLGTPRGIETKLVPEAGFPLELMQVGQLANVSLLTRIKTLADLPLGILHCIRLLRSFRPQVVVGVGGYASGPAMIAATLLRISTLAYEPNAVPGMVNRVLGKRVSAAAVAFEETRSYFRNAEVTGVPVRSEIFQTGSLVTQPPRLLITAGSNGAKVFNDTVPLIAADLLTAIPHLTIVHQTGERAFAATETAYRNAGIPAERVTVLPFLKDMPQQLEQATLVLARSGSTVAELAAAGRPALLVPFPQAADDHQTKNALAMVRIGAAEMLPQAELTPDILRTRLIALLTAPGHLQKMSQAARSGAKPDALQNIGNRIVSLAR